MALIDHINKYTNAKAQGNKARDFNYFITEPEKKNIAVTYSVKEKDRFWGLSTQINEQDFVDWLVCKNSPLANKDKLDEKVTELINNNLWIYRDVNDSSEEAKRLEKSMCKRTLLSFAMHFYTYYKCDERTKEILKSVWQDTVDAKFDNVDINDNLQLFAEEKGEYIKVNGRIPDSIINILMQLKNKIYCNLIDGVIDERNVQVVDLTATEENGVSIENFFFSEGMIEKRKQAIQCVSNLFYSGAMARVVEIQAQNNLGNNDVYNYLFLLESISYATHIGLKDPRMGNSKDFFSDEEREILKNNDKEEVEYQRTLIERLEGCGDSIKAINDYLKASKCTHGMNTSSNIITSDDYVLYTIRGKTTFDKGTLYCSANGVCELFDKKVAFYHHSVDSDLPSITERHDFGSFGGELTREAYGELSCFIEPSTWNYYGFSVMGHTSADGEHAFPLHFNILASGKAKQTLKEIKKHSKNAVEKEENERILGVKIETYTNLRERIGAMLNNVLEKIVYNKDLILDMLIVINVVSNFIFKPENSENVTGSIVQTIVNIVSAVLSIFVVIHGIFSFKTKCKEKRYFKNCTTAHRCIKSFNKLDCSSQEIFDKFFKKLAKKANCYKENPIYVLMMQLYFLDCYHEEKKK